MLEELELLRDELLIEKTRFIGTVEAIYHVLNTSPEVIRVRNSINSGLIDEKSLQKFVFSLTKNYTLDNHSFDIPFATLAIAVKDSPSLFSREYLTQLSKVNITELKFASRIAKICLGLKSND